MTNLSPALLRFGDVSVRLAVELGRTDMPLRDVLSLGQGSVVALNRLTDELLDITANGKVVARGEVIAQDGKFALRIVNLVGEDPNAANAAPSPSVAPRSQGQDTETGVADTLDATLDDLTDALGDIAPAQRGDANDGGPGS